MNIYISGLDTNVTNDSLKTIFSSYGEVSSSKIMVDGFTGFSRGFGFVEMPDSEEGTKAIEAINGSTIDGRKVAVKESTPEPEHKGSYPVGVRSRK